MIKENCALNVKQTVADEILQMQSNLVERMEGLTNRIDNQLSRFCQQANPTDSCHGECQQNFPPYFDDLRNKISIVNNLIDRIYNILDRAEL